MIPFVINSNICTTQSDISNYSVMMDVISGNVGNSYITWSLLKECGCTLNVLEGHEIKSLHSYDFSNAERDLAMINEECTHVILILQDQIRVHESYGLRLPYTQLSDFISKIKKPILVAGLGANSLEGFVPHFYKLLDDEQVRFWRLLGEKCNSIGVRGYFTAEVLNDLGIKNVRVIGCPSYFECGNDRIVTNPDSADITRIGIASYPPPLF